MIDQYKCFLIKTVHSLKRGMGGGKISGYDRPKKCTFTKTVHNLKRGVGGEIFGYDRPIKTCILTGYPDTRPEKHRLGRRRR